MREQTMGGMRPPSINLARRPFRNNTVHYTVFGVCAVLLAVATFVNVREFFLRGSELVVLREQLTIGRQRYDRLFQEVETMKREISQVNLELLDDKSAFVNGLILSRLFSWSLLFDRFEGLIPYDVKIRSIRPSISAKEIEIQIDGMAKSYLDFYEFEANLGNSDFFAGVYPVGENMRESKTELNFDVIMKYLPAGKTSRYPSPPTPTAGLPESEAPSDPNAAAQDPNAAADAEPPAGDAAENAPDAAGEPAAPQAAPAQAPPVQQAAPAAPQREPQPGAVDAGTAGAAQETPDQTPPTPRAELGPLARMSNKEFWDKRGEARFMGVRGGLVPRTPDDQPGISNAEYITQFGVEQFMTRRGNLTMADQQLKPPVAP